MYLSVAFHHLFRQSDPFGSCFAEIDELAFRQFGKVGLNRIASHLGNLANYLGGGVGAYGQRAMAYIDPDGKGRCTVIRDGNRYFYIKNKATGTVFNPGQYPVLTPVENYYCTHGLGYSEIHGECEGIGATARMYVNDTDPCEIWKITLTNNTGADASVSL